MEFSIITNFDCRTCWPSSTYSWSFLKRLDSAAKKSPHNHKSLSSIEASVGLFFISCTTYARVGKQAHFFLFRSIQHQFLSQLKLACVSVCLFFQLFFHLSIWCLPLYFCLQFIGPKYTLTCFDLHTYSIEYESGYFDDHSPYKS